MTPESPVRFLRLSCDGVRCLQGVELRPGPGVNVIVGPNGSGKTSLLETLYLLTYGRSFRTRRWEDLRGRGRDGFVAFAEVGGMGGPAHRVGAELRERERRMRLDGREVRSALELEGLPRVLVYGPGSEGLVGGEPGVRRRALDWVVFHVEHAHGARVRELEKTLAQRNRALREPGAGRTLPAWTTRLVEIAERVHGARAGVLERLLPRLEAWGAALVGRPVAASYERGWSEEETLGESLARLEGNDRERGWTGAGAHRAELRFRAGAQDLRVEGSRGEQKLVAAAWFLAARDVVREVAPVVVLVDDLAAELDAGARERVLAGLRDGGDQAVLTALGEGALGPSLPGDASMFHVEHGRVREVV